MSSRPAEGLRFAALVRVSDASQGDRSESLRVQQDRLREIVQMHGGSIPPAIWDKYKGQEHATPGHERELFERLLIDARDGLFDAVIVYDPTRWSRDNKKSKEGLAILRKNSIRFFVGTIEIDLYDPQQTMILGIQVEVAEGQAQLNIRKSILSKISLAKRINAPMTSRPNQWWYGRTWIWEDKRRKIGHWEIDEEKKSKILWAVDRYLNYGESLNYLAKTLGISYSSKKYPYQKLYEIFKRQLGDTWIQKWDLPERGISEAVPTKVPPLIDDPNIISLVHQKLSDSKQNTNANKKHTYLLSKKVTCADCGGHLSGGDYHGKLTYHHWHSGKARNGGTACTSDGSPRIDSQELDRAVFAYVFNLLGDPISARKAVALSLPRPQVREEKIRQVQHLMAIKAALKTQKSNMMEAMKELGKHAADDDFRQELDHIVGQSINIGIEIDKLNTEIARMPTKQAIMRKIIDSVKLLNAVFKRASSQYSHFKEMPFEDKRRLIEWVFQGRDENGGRYGVYIRRLQEDQWIFELRGRLPEPVSDSLPLSQDDESRLVRRPVLSDLDPDDFIPPLSPDEYDRLLREYGHYAPLDESPTPKGKVSGGWSAPG